MSATAVKISSAGTIGGRRCDLRTCRTIVFDAFLAWPTEGGSLLAALIPVRCSGRPCVDHLEGRYTCDKKCR